MRRPRVGITIAYDGSREDVFSLRHDYVRSVERAGGLPLVLVPGHPEDAASMLDAVDALLLSGGSDVDPALYGETSHAKVSRVIRERDEFEIALCREALERDLPLLAICRGQQVLNVAAGGTLVQDIPSQLTGAVNHDPDTPRWETVHDVRILPGTRLRAILGQDRMPVNSFHHQAVKDVGRGLIVSARSRGDDVIEGVESPGHAFVVGVQWHPESFWRRSESFAGLFGALVEAGHP